MFKTNSNLSIPAWKSQFKHEKSSNIAHIRVRFNSLIESHNLKKLPIKRYLSYYSKNYQNPRYRLSPLEESNQLRDMKHAQSCFQSKQTNEQANKQTRR